MFWLYWKGKKNKPLWNGTCSSDLMMSEYTLWVRAFIFRLPLRSSSLLPHSNVSLVTEGREKQNQLQLSCGSNSSSNVSGKGCPTNNYVPWQWAKPSFNFLYWPNRTLSSSMWRSYRNKIESMFSPSAKRSKCYKTLVASCKFWTC